MNVVSIPAHLPFLDTLARGLLGEGPVDGRDIVMLPTHRSGRAFANALLRANGGKALLLPRLLALGEPDPDMTEIEVAADEALAEELALPPAIAPLRRALLLTRLVQRHRPELGQARSFDLAKALARLIDEVQFNRLDFDRLEEVVPAEFAEHWQITLRFLSIVTEAWPRVLRDEGRLDPIDRRNRLIGARIRLWENNPPDTRVVVAGSTGIMPATSDLIGLVAGLPRGLVILPGLDRHLDGGTWETLEPTHPQWAFARLLETLGVDREAVRDWPESAEPTPRTRLFAEAMRPAATTGRWRSLPAEVAEGCEGLSHAAFPNPVAEAGGIALMLREAVEEGRSASLVTPDRNLARRVAAELRRWNLLVDDSAGTPLDLTQPGAFMRLAAWAMASDFAPVQLLALLKHPLVACGSSPGRFRDDVRRLERAILRGLRPGQGLAGLLDAARRSDEAAAARGGGRREILPVAERIAAALEPLSALAARDFVPVSELIEAHVVCCERGLAHSRGEKGAARLWRGEAGEALHGLLGEFGAAATDLPPIDARRDYAPLFDQLLAGNAVRLQRPSHPGLAILSPLESRLQTADRVVLAGLNHNGWPREPVPNPWMSRGMASAFGLPPAGVRIGLGAHDFAQAAGAAEVILTRSERRDGDPAVPSRWLQRLDAVLNALGASIEDPRWAAWQELIDRPEKVEAIAPPEPRPPLVARPRRISATGVERWLGDPYGIFARDILRLYALDPIDMPPGPRERGNAVHDALEKFTRRHSSGELPEGALEELLELGGESFDELLRHPVVSTFWFRRFRRAAEKVIVAEAERRESLETVLVELEGRLLFEDMPGGSFELTAKADRIEVWGDGLVIADYKTGSPPSRRDVGRGPVRQLPVEAIIAEAGGFPGCPPLEVNQLEYWAVGGRNDDIFPMELSGGRPPLDVRDLIDETEEGLRRFIAAFDSEDMPYLAEPRPDFQPAFNDYRHLSRRDEWLPGL